MKQQIPSIILYELSDFKPTSIYHLANRLNDPAIDRDKVRYHILKLVDYGLVKEIKGRAKKGGSLYMLSDKVLVDKDVMILRYPFKDGEQIEILSTRVLEVKTS